MKDIIQTKIKEAMKAGDKTSLSVYRAINAAFIDYEKEKAGNTIDPAIGIKIISKMAKSIQESIESYQQGGRDDLVQKEQSELQVVQELLPKQLDEVQVKAIVDEVRLTTGLNGVKLIGPVMKRVAGQADGNMVRKLCEQLQ